ncbi:immunity 8 family protein [Photorhabdus sp. SF281]|uniref:immunity 8 family protein n=1 Tax=Photorhabdus sp. SF281 TaxID=3459527 RepID=UPI004043F887
MKAELKSISSDDYDLDSYFPDNEEEFLLRVILRIGEKDSEGADNFDLFICTPDWLLKHHWTPELIRHMLLVRKYDLVDITKTITDYIDKCECKDWEEIAEKLSRVFAWEYEDYQS